MTKRRATTLSDAVQLVLDNADRLHAEATALDQQVISICALEPLARLGHPSIRAVMSLQDRLLEAIRITGGKVSDRQLAEALQTSRGAVQISLVHLKRQGRINCPDRRRRSSGPIQIVSEEARGP